MRSTSQQWTALKIALVVAALIAVDQATKIAAWCWTADASTAMASTSRMWAFAWHLHAPNEFTTVSSMAALACVGLLCLLPVPGAVKILWGAAALSNHVEMLARPGTMDFLAFRFDSHVLVANIADLYFAAGMPMLAYWAFKLIRQSQGLFQPVRVQ